jgi:hypothetical protein
MRLTRSVSIALGFVAIALTWLSLAGVRTAALLLKALGSELGAELLLPARILHPAATAAMVVLASAGTLLLILTQVGKVHQEVKLLVLCGYICTLTICLLVAFVVSILQVHTLLFPPLVPGISF